MSASVTGMHDFIAALDRAAPRGLHPTTDVALDEYFIELRDKANNPTAACEVIGKICARVVQELSVDH
jgi:hypothetical protein